MEGQFAKSFLTLVKPFASDPEHLKKTATVHNETLIQVKDMFSICCEAWLNK
jgi:hypothetical protein